MVGYEVEGLRYQTEGTNLNKKELIKKKMAHGIRLAPVEHDRCLLRRFQLGKEAWRLGVECKRDWVFSSMRHAGFFFLPGNACGCIYTIIPLFKQQRQSSQYPAFASLLNPEEFKF